MGSDREATHSDPQEWDLQRVAVELGFSDRAHLESALGAVHGRGYHVFRLPDGRGRSRVISAPHDWLKIIQRRAYDSLLRELPISDAVYNRAGRGVIKNAEQHLGHAYLTIVDVADCFPSTTVETVRNAFLRLGVPSDVAGALTRLGTHRGFLPQGPPTSPGILDLVFSPIDERLLELAAIYGATYTRYMDDLAFSGDQSLDGLRRRVGRALRDFRYSSNQRKCRVWGPNDPHTVTKIVVNTTLNPTPEFLEALTTHLCQLEAGNCRLTQAQLRGMVNWVSRLNPLLGKRLASRLGHAGTPTSRSHFSRSARLKADARY
jgi:RNA-directed DNA polymerase